MRKSANDHWWQDGEWIKSCVLFEKQRSYSNEHIQVTAIRTIMLNIKLILCKEPRHWGRGSLWFHLFILQM